MCRRETYLYRHARVSNQAHCEGVKQKRGKYECLGSESSWVRGRGNMHTSNANPKKGRTSSHNQAKPGKVEEEEQRQGEESELNGEKGSEYGTGEEKVTQCVVRILSCMVIRNAVYESHRC